MSQRNQVFVCYSHKDDEHLNRLQIHFKPFEREFAIKLWSDSDIKASNKWREQIQNALQHTAVAILLISADFLYSDFIVNDELPHLLDADQNEGVKIIPFILKKCAFKFVPSLSKYQAVNDPNNPLISLDESEQESLWLQLALATKDALDEFKAQVQATQAAKNSASSRDGKVQWNKVATLFWLGNDLMWIKDMTYRDASPERVLQGVNHALQYVEELGFDKHSLPIEQLTLSKLTLEHLVGIAPSTEEKKSFLQGHYGGVRQHIDQVKWYINALATNQQPDFKKLTAI